MSYSPNQSKYLTVAQTSTNRGTKDVKIILDVDTNDFYTLDDDGNFNIIGGGTGLDYKEYVAYVIVTGGGVVPTIAKNDLGFTPTISKTSTGEYTITAIGGFPDFEKVVMDFNPQQGSPTFWNIFWNDADSLIVNTWDASGTLADLFFGNLTIKIYN